MTTTPPNLQGEMNIGTPPSMHSEAYSDEYNDYWDRYVNNGAENQMQRETNSDDFIQGPGLRMEDLNDEDIDDEEIIPGPATPITLPVIKADWAERDMPPIPKYDNPVINVTGEGIDPIMSETRSIKEYLEEDKKDNIAVLYNGKTYLTSRSIIEQQEDDALVYECLQADKKKFTNIVGNLPLYNIKKIGLDISSDNAVGTEAEYIYMGGMDSLLLDTDWQLYAIIPLVDKQLVSVISLNEAQKVGTGQGSGLSALHCQAGQGGLAGIIVKAEPASTGGKRRKGTMKKRKLGKHRKSMKKRKGTKKRFHKNSLKRKY